MVISSSILHLTFTLTHSLHRHRNMALGLHSNTDTYFQAFRRQHTIPAGIWHPDLQGPHPSPDIRMAGSTSDDQSVFDHPLDSAGTTNASRDRLSSESSASPPYTASAHPESQHDASEAAAAAAAGADDSSHKSKIKRIACVICRKRKLRCDGARPCCGTCARLRHDCGYDETRKKSGPKRGYVKQLEQRSQHLEQRLKQIEHRLKSDGATATGRDKSPMLGAGLHPHGFDPTASTLPGGLLGVGRTSPLDTPGIPQQQQQQSLDPECAEGFPWEMIGLGLEEPLPHPDVVSELHQIYFDKLHSSMPMIHKYRYLAAMNLAPSMRPPVALRYAVWAYACSASEKHASHQEVFYARARKYAEADEMKGFGEQIFTIGHAQAWVIIANYEFKMLYFPRAWMSVGRAVRLAQMLGLYRVDGGGLEVKECIGAPKDWVDREERRRTFWAAYCFDRWASIGTGWPMNIEESDIHTNLPVADDAFDKGKEQEGESLAGILKGGSPANCSSYASVILMASVIGKTLTHLHRADAGDDAGDADTSEFWKRHSYLDHILTSTTVCLPEHLRLVAGITDPNVIFLHMNIHSTAICLHQAAILKAEQKELGEEIIKRSTQRCYVAATEIANIWRTISHLDISYLSPYLAFCMFVAARVFVHAYKKNPDDEDTRRSLHFLLSAMEAHRKRNDITESFLMQLLADLDQLGFESMVLRRHTAFASKRDAYSVYQEGKTCPLLMQKHSATQPTYHDLRMQHSDAQRMAAAYNQQSTSGANLAPAQLNMPIRPSMGGPAVGMENQRPLPGSQLHGVSMGQDYSLGPQYSHPQGMSPNDAASGYAGQQPFTLPSQSSPHSNGQSPATHGQAGGYYNGDFDVSMLNGTFAMDQDPNLMQDLQHAEWANMGSTFPDASHHEGTPSWQQFI